MLIVGFGGCFRFTCLRRHVMFDMETVLFIYTTQDDEALAVSVNPAIFIPKNRLFMFEQHSAGSE